MTAAAFNMDEVRGSFPSLTSPSRDQVFFDNAGGSQTLGTVADRIRDYLTSTNVQLGATYVTSKKSTALYGEGYAAAATHINAAPDEIVLGSSTTQLFRNFSYALDFQPGDQLLVSLIDHEANIAPWVDLARRQHLVLNWWRPSSTSSATSPILNAGDLTALLTPRTRLVACTAASNLLGTIHDVSSFSAAIRRGPSPEALLVVDAVSFAPHRPVDVKAWGADVVSFSWYKVYGPHLAILYAGKERAMRQMGSLGHYFIAPPALQTLDQRLGLAGASYELVHALPAVLEYLTPKWGGIVAQELKLQAALLGFLNGRDDVTVWGERSADTSLRVATVSFTVKGWSSRNLVEMVERESNFGFRWGGFYSVRLLKEILGLDDDGVVRVSMVHYNTVGEVEGLIAVLVKLLSRK